MTKGIKRYSQIPSLLFLQADKYLESTQLLQHDTYKSMERRTSFKTSTDFIQYTGR